MLHALHRAKKTKKNKIQFLSTNLSFSSRMEYKPVTLNCIAFWFCVAKMLFMVSQWQGKKSSPTLPPVNIFNHFKLKLETGLEGRTVTGLFINKNPIKSLIAFSPDEGLQYLKSTRSNHNLIFK